MYITSNLKHISVTIGPAILNVISLSTEITSIHKSTSKSLKIQF